jgi:hypothetical protein
VEAKRSSEGQTPAALLLSCFGAVLALSEVEAGGQKFKSLWRIRDRVKNNK